MKKIFTVLSIFVFLVSWELLSSRFPTLNFFLSSPMASLSYASIHFSNILKSTWVTLFETLAGFVFAIVFSFIVMILCLLYPPVFKIIRSVFITSQVLPIITLAPVFIIIFGMGVLSKIAMVALLCFFPMFINFSTGAKRVSDDTRELLYIYNAGKVFRILKIYLPLATKEIFTGLKISTPMAIMGAIVAEFVGAKYGLGKNLYLAPKHSQPELMICSIVLTTLLGLLLYKTVERAEKIFGKWYLNS